MHRAKRIEQAKAEALAHNIRKAQLEAEESWKKKQSALQQQYVNEKTAELRKQRDNATTARDTVQLGPFADKYGKVSVFASTWIFTISSCIQHLHPCRSRGGSFGGTAFCTLVLPLAHPCSAFWASVFGLSSACESLQFGAFPSLGLKTPSP